MNILHDELINDPLARGYAEMTDEEAADDLNTVYRTITRSTMDSAEIYERLDVAEFQAKTDAQKVYVRDVLNLGANVRVGPGSKARTVMINIFGAGSNTIANLAVALDQNVSRATELGLGSVTPGDVTAARAYGSV